MAVGKIMIDAQAANLFQQLQERLGGYCPILNTYTDNRPLCSASLHQPTLYPELSVPLDDQGDWGEVVRGIAHLISTLDGVPELRATNDLENGHLIAQAINSEIQVIAAAKENLQPKPKWHAGTPAKLLYSILETSSVNHIVQTCFRIIQLYRLVLDEHPEAQQALDEVCQTLPEITKAAQITFHSILSQNLRTPAGKASAASLLIDFLGLETKWFYLQNSLYVDGVHDDRSLGYYPVIDSIRNEFESFRPSPGCWLKCSLPFALPILEGIYKVNDVTLLIQHKRVFNAHAGCTATLGMRLDTMMNPSGHYSQSVLEIWFSEQLDIDIAQPPCDVQYQNIAVFPEVVKVAVITINQLIVGLRAETGRSDIPEVLPSSLNQLSFKQFDSAGNIARDIPLVNLEFVKVTTGAPSLNSEVQQGVYDLNYPGFMKELLESAKYHVIAYNMRRAVLDLAGAFEAFVEMAITRRLTDVEETTKNKFLRLYGSKLSTEVLAELSGLDEELGTDSPRMPSVHRQIKEYKRQHLKPALNKKHISAISKVMNYRNDAAHGRAVSENTLKDITAGILALEFLIQDQFSSLSEDR